MIKSPKNIPFIFTIVIFLSVGITFLAFGIISICIHYTKMHTYKTTRGEIVDVVESEHTSTHRTSSGHRSRRTSTVYSPLYEYEVDGKTYKFCNNIYSSRYPTIGASATIYYNPKDPGDAYMKQSAVMGIIFSIIGVVLTGFGIVFGSIYRKKRKADALQESNFTAP
ncbi:MAG: DUF3592 domain-containing protein [Lachnospiraceae bacterium]|nr:DUF3592 domain-containing protein [Lachnospiraceae bacterium]